MASTDFGAIQIDSRTGRTTMSPKVNGFDPTQTVNDIIDAKTKIQTAQPQKKLVDIDNKTSMLSEFEGLVESYKTSLTALRGVSEGIKQAGDLGKFSPQATTSLNPGSVKNAPSAVTDLIQLFTDSGTDPLAFNLQVNRLAQQDLLKGTQSFGPANQALNATGTLTFPDTTTNTGSLPPVDITITADMSLNDIVQAVNAQKDITGVMAGKIAISATENILYFQSSKTGAPISATYSNDLSQALGAKLPPAATQSLAFINASSPQNTLNLQGNFFLGASATPIAVNPTDSLQSIMSSINAQTTTTNISASLVSDNANGYKLELTTSDNAPVQISSDTALQDSIKAARTMSLSAEIVYQGSIVNRPSNQINDLIPNSSLTLKQADPATSIAVKIAPPVDKVTDDIQNWITQHNKLVDFMKGDSVNLTGEGAEKDVTFSVLKDSDSIKSVNSFLGNILASKVDGLASNVAAGLASIGISLGIDGKLSIDQTPDAVTKNTKLETMLENKFSQVQKVLAFDWGSSNSKFFVNDHPSNLNSQISQNGITVTINRDASGTLTGTFQVPGTNGFTANAALKFMGDAAAITVDPKDPHADVLKGLRLSVQDLSTVANNSSTSTAINITQGIGDRLLRSFEQLNYPGDEDPVTKKMVNQGILVLERDKFIADKKSTQDQVETIKSKLSVEKERLVQKYAAMTRAVSQLEQFQEQLKSFTKSLEQ